MLDKQTICPKPSTDGLIERGGTGRERQSWTERAENEKNFKDFMAQMENRFLKTLHVRMMKTTIE